MGCKKRHQYLLDVFFSLSAIVIGLLFTNIINAAPGEQEQGTQQMKTGENAAVTLVRIAGGFSAPVQLTNAGDDSGRMFVVEDSFIKVWDTPGMGVNLIPDKATQYLPEGDEDFFD